MTFEVTRLNDAKTVVISIGNTLGFDEVREFRSAYLDNKADSYILDFTAVKKIDSSALGMLLHMRRELGEQVKITLKGCQAPVLKIFKISRLDRKFDIE